MKVIVGRDASRTNIQVPPQFKLVSRVHASIVDGASAAYQLEDLGSTHGTFVFSGNSWKKITRAKVEATTPILLADFRTTVAELLSSRQISAAQVLPLASGPSGLSAGQADSDGFPIELLLRMVGLNDLKRIITTLHAPLRSVRQLIAEPQKALYQAMLAYVAILALMPVVQNNIMEPLGAAVHYPLVAHGQALENGFLMSIIALISNTIAFSLMYALPQSLYTPSTKNIVIASNIYIGMYLLIYGLATDVLKFAAWEATGNLRIAMLLGWSNMALALVLQLYAWRRILQLRWPPIVLFLVIGLVFTFVYGFVLGATGLIKFETG